MAKWPRQDEFAHLNPGLLRDRVTIYRRTITKSEDTGADVVTYTEPFLSNVSAAMNPEGGQKFFAAQRFNTENLETCMLHYQAGIDTSMQLEFEEQRFEIMRVDDVNRRKRKLMLALRRLS